MNTAVNILASDPTRYGLTVDRHSSVTVPNQMIAQLPSLLLRTGNLESLADAVIAKHNRNPNVDFSEEFLKTKGVARITKPLVAPETLLKTGAGTLLVGAALYGFKKLSERKRIGEAQALIETLLKDTPDRQQYFLKGLQLDASSKAVDHPLRQKTLQDLIHDSRTNAALKPVLTKLRLLMDEKSAKKLQKSLEVEAQEK